MVDDERDRKRKKDKHGDHEERSREKRSKRPRSRSSSPARRDEKDSRRKRRHSRSQSPRKRYWTVPNEAPKTSEVKIEAPERKKKDEDMLNTRTGGAYIPPARLRMMQAQITDKSSIAYQRLAWEALKKSIHGHINKINVGNIGIIIKELLRENIIRGRGLLCRSVIQAQAASPTFTNVYAALVAAVNSRFPNIGELLLKRLVIQFKRGFKRNDKSICISSASFIAHLVNQRVAHEILALELLTLLVETPTDDSVEVAIAFLKECGQKLTEVSSKGVNAIFEMLRNILHEGQLDKRVQYMIEVMFQVWKDGFKDHPALIEELELVPEEEQFTHLLMLDEATDAQDILNVFKHDEKYEENEQKYKDLSKEILGSDAESGEEESGSESGSEEEEEEESENKPVTIIDNTETNLIALRRTIYLTINSSLDFEECAHKLLKMQLKPGQEVELCHMFLDCCAEQRTYEKFYGLLAQRFCNINRIYIGPFEEIFKDSYATAHRLDTNRLRNVSKFFAHLLFTDSISWEVLECVKLNEEDTTSSNRIYIKILFQELAEYMGLKKLNDRLQDPTLQGAFAGVFPRDNPKNTRFSINFFTSIGLGGLTDELREHLKQMPKNVPPAITEIKVDSESSSDSSSSSSSSSDSSSSSESEDDEENEKNSKSKKSKEKSKKKKEESPKPSTPAGDKNSGIIQQAKERWGHDGFYDTYGQDARRLERSDDGHFAKPYPRDRQGRRDDDRGRRDDDSGRRDNERGRRDDDRGRRDDDRGRRDDDSGRRDNERGRRDDDRGRRDDDKGHRDDERSRRDDNDRGRSDRGSDKENSDSRQRTADVRYEDDREQRRHDDGYESRSRSDRDRHRNERDGREMEEHKSRNGRDDREIRRNERDNRESRRNERDDRDSRSNVRDSKRNERDDRDSRRNNGDGKESDDSKSRKHDDEGYESRSKRKDKPVENKRRDESSDESDRGSKKKRKDSSDEQSDSSEAGARKKDKSSKKKKLKDKKEEDSSDEERTKKSKKKKSKKAKGNDDDWDIKNKDEVEPNKTKRRKEKKQDTEEWDIRREASVAKEVGRYWDNHKARDEGEEGTPERRRNR